MADQQVWPISWWQGLLDSKPPPRYSAFYLWVWPQTTSSSRRFRDKAFALTFFGAVEVISCFRFSLCMPKQRFGHSRRGYKSTGCFCWRNCKRRNICRFSSIALHMAVVLRCLQRKRLSGNPHEISHCAGCSSLFQADFREPAIKRGKLSDIAKKTDLMRSHLKWFYM